MEELWALEAGSDVAFKRGEGGSDDPRAALPLGADPRASLSRQMQQTEELFP